MPQVMFTELPLDENLEVEAESAKGEINIFPGVAILTGIVLAAGAMVALQFLKKR